MDYSFREMKFLKRQLKKREKFTFYYFKFNTVENINIKSSAFRVYNLCLKHFKKVSKRNNDVS